MNRFIVSLFGGLANGGVYTLIALGIVLAYRATGTFNFAHGQFMALTAFISGAWITTTHAPRVLAVAAAMLVPALVAGAFYLVVLRRMAGLPHFMGVIATLGLASIIDGAMLLWFSGNAYDLHVPGVPTGVTTIFGARISSAGLTTTVVTCVIAGIVILALRYTQIGRMLHAAGQDTVLASQSGINVKVLQAGSWMFAGFLAGLAGMGYAATHVVEGTITGVALAAFPAVLVGGLDSVAGALVGGLAIGVFQGFITTYYGGEYIDVTTYGLLLVVLLVRPQGLFGTERVSRV